MTETVEVIRTDDRFANFTKGKIYTGEIRNRFLDGRIATVVILDDDKDPAVITDHNGNLNNGWGYA